MTKSYFTIDGIKFDSIDKYNQYLVERNNPEAIKKRQEALEKLEEETAKKLKAWEESKEKEKTGFDPEKAGYPYPIKPMFNRVLIQRDGAEVKSTGGIILNPIADQKKNAPSTGTILDIGESCDDPIKLLKGKRVMFARFAGDWLKFPNIEEEYFICSDEDILGEIFY